MRNLKNAVSANSMVMSSLLKHSFCQRAVFMHSIHLRLNRRIRQDLAHKARKQGDLI
ncbi:hypothetical protein [Legionella erythra]|uniref:hypothetical protein n=1 Tax=Legionella erythra TaxID=448 RepID=UPI0013EF66B8|nr:hypothetical protein [Legionella erythra]